MLCNIAGSQLEERKGGCRSTAHHSTWHAYVAYCLRISCRIFRVTIFPASCFQIFEMEKDEIQQGKIARWKGYAIQKTISFLTCSFLGKSSRWNILDRREYYNLERRIGNQIPGITLFNDPVPCHTLLSVIAEIANRYAYRTSFCILRA